MLKNVRLKVFLMKTVFSAAGALNAVIPKNPKKVLLYANEGFRDNTRYLFDYMTEHGLQQKYRLIVAADDFETLKKAPVPGVRYESCLRGMLDYLTAGTVYYSFGKIPIVPGKGQRAVQMWHGTSFKGFDKSLSAGSSLGKQYYTHVFASSEYFSPIVQKKFGVTADRIFICGHPRTDVFYERSGRSSAEGSSRTDMLPGAAGSSRTDILPDAAGPSGTDVSGKRGNVSLPEHTLIWLPTFRKSERLGYADTKQTSVLPIFGDDELKMLDKRLMQLGLHLIVKLHPLQDTASLKGFKTERLKLMTQKDFDEKGYDLYRILPETAALITDYSSVFYDYLLLDKPIGFTEDDEGEYRTNRGFAVDDPDAMKPGMRIPDQEAFYRFLENVAFGIDDFKEKRRQINDLANQWQDGGNCRRALKAGGLNI